MKCFLFGVVLVITASLPLAANAQGTGSQLMSRVEERRQTIWIGVDLKLGMAENEAIKKIAEAGYDATKAASVAEDVRKRGVTSFWTIQERQDDGRGKYIGVIGFTAGKLSGATREWISFRSDEGVQFAKNLYFLLRGFQEEGNAVCRIRTSAGEVPDASLKQAVLQCGRKKIVLVIDKFPNQREIVQLNEHLGEAE